jgi:hypothetical protein
MRTNLLRIVILTGAGVGLAGCTSAGGEPEPMGDEDLIDDLEDGDDAINEANGRLGGWYTFHDDTGGTQTPPDTGFTPSPGGAGDSAYAASTTGSGFTEWGAGMGFDLNNPEAVGETGMRGPYDVSGYSMVAFSAKGNVLIRVALETLAVIPVDRGGSCVAGATEEEACDDLHGVNLALTDDWKDYTISFSQLRQGGWGKAFPFEPEQATALLFQTEKDLEFDFAVDDVRFYE